MAGQVIECIVCGSNNVKLFIPIQKSAYAKTACSNNCA